VIPVEQYSGSSEVLEMEVGNYKNVRFLMTTLQGGGATGGPIQNGGGATGGADVQSTGGTLADVYLTTIFATEAIASVPLDGMSLQNIIKPLGSAGSADPLNQICTSGWKHTGTRRRLQEVFLVRLETTAGKNEP
jgi:N4-gp56 family major capsid protein